MNCTKMVFACLPVCSLLWKLTSSVRCSPAYSVTNPVMMNPHASAMLSRSTPRYHPRSPAISPIAVAAVPTSSTAYIGIASDCGSHPTWLQMLSQYPRMAIHSPQGNEGSKIISIQPYPGGFGSVGKSSPYRCRLRISHHALNAPVPAAKQPARIASSRSVQRP